MEAWIEVARGRLLVFAVAVMGLGLARQVALTVAELVHAYLRAGDRDLPLAALARRLAGWLVPVRAMRGRRAPHNAASVLFHAGVILVPLFLAGHVALVDRAWGVSWPVLPDRVADLLTLATLAALAVLLLSRAWSPATRVLTRTQDWLLPVLLSAIVLTGFWVAHPRTSLLPFQPTYLLHLLAAETLMVLVPFTKLSHLVLFPFTQLSWELGWHFVPGAGARVRATLGKEGDPV